jgi:predicted nicotinamide N-methyase
VRLAGELRLRFDVVEEEVAVGSRTFVIARPRSAEALIDEADFARDERLPYWADVWPSAIALAEVVLGLAGGEGRALELGCGVGLVACAAAAAGFDVTVSDYYEAALGFATANVTANSGRAARPLALDWRDPGMPAERYDLVLAADVLYERPYGALVAAAVASLLAPGGTALVADPGRVAAADFAREAELLGLGVAVRERRPVGDGTQRHEIVVYELTRAAG